MSTAKAKAVKPAAKPAARRVAAKPAASKPAAAKRVVAAKPAAKPAVKAPAAKAAPVRRAAPAKPAAVAKPAPKAVAKPVKLAKPVKAVKAPKAEKPQDKAARPHKEKLVRDSFTMPETEYAVLGQVKKACLKAGVEVKKSELLRIGVSLISRLDMAALKEVLGSLPQLKTGRPKKN